MKDHKTSELLFFFGAGASASFDIPTMKQLVIDFETFLSNEGTKDEKEKYTDIKEKLEDRLGKPVDLEAIFTVIDGLLEYNPERLGFLSLYLSETFAKPKESDLKIYETLRNKFQSFIKEKCAIHPDFLGHIDAVYQDFFNRFALEFENGVTRKGNFAWRDNWTIFTTNYDTCLEYYWRCDVGIDLDTGFAHDKVRKRDILQPRRFLQEDVGLQLIKLHGSVNWLLEKETGVVTEQEITGGRSHMGTAFLGEFMLYPIAEKELYLDPYVSMLLRLNRELERRSVWIVVGYSFNDPVIREIFLKKSNEAKHLVLVHKEAKKVKSQRLHDFRGKISAMETEFGKKKTFWSVNYSTIHKLKYSPKFPRGRVTIWT